MPIYDNNGTANNGISKVYDYDGTANHQIGKVYDNDGTADSLLYSAEMVLFDKDTGINLLSDGWTVVENYIDLCTQREIGALNDGYLKMRGNANTWWRAAWKSKAAFDCSSYSKLCFTFTAQKNLAENNHYAGLDTRSYTDQTYPQNAVICNTEGTVAYAGEKYTRSIELTEKGELPIYFFACANGYASHKDIWLLFEKIWFE